MPELDMTDSLPRRALLGVSFDTQDASRGGLVVHEIEPDSMAAAAGIKASDVLEAVGEKAIATLSDVADAARRCANEQSTGLTFRRGAERLQREVAIQSWPLEEHRGSTVSYEAIDRPGALLRLIVTRPIRPSRTCIFYLPGIALESIEADAQPHIGELIAALTSRRLATARLERRGLGDSTGGPAGAVDFQTEVSDVASALKSLAARFERVVLLGHSVGGMIAPLVADCGAFGVAVYGSSALPWFRCVELSTRRQLESAGALPGDIEAALTQAQADRRRRRSDDERPFAFHEQLAAADIANRWRGISIPTLAIWGSHDLVVSRPEAEEIAALSGGELRVVSGLDHAGAPQSRRIGEALAAWLDAMIEA